MPSDSNDSPLLANFPLHLGPGGSATPQPQFTGDMDWYAGYGSRHGGDGANGQLVSMHTFDAPWSSWEMHPAGAEVVVVTSGAMTLVQELENGEVRDVPLSAGQYVINPPGVWHTADAEAPVTALFITTGIGTEHRPR